MKKYLLAAWMLLLLLGTANADTITASSNSQADVQTAVDSAVSGDVVEIPTGGGTVSWSTYVNIPSGKNIHLKGPGSGVLTVTLGNNIGVFIHSGSRVSGIKFDISSNTGGSAITATGQNFRIDHCAFYNSNAVLRNGVNASGLAADGNTLPEGVVDHCNFTNSRINFSGTDNTNVRSASHWNDAINLSDSLKKVFSEDNYYYYSPAFSGQEVNDSNYGGNFVMRYNTVYGNYAYMMAHSLQNAGGATRTWQFYGNLITGTTTVYASTPIRIRGGTGLAFFNSSPSSTWINNTIGFDNRRPREYLVTDNAYCNGSSSWDGNEAIPASYYGSSGTGTATSDDPTGKLLTDSTKSWTTSSMFKTDMSDQYSFGAYTGTHTGSDSSTVLTKASGYNWPIAGGIRPIGLYVRNVTDGSGCVVTANTATTLTCSLSGGTDNTWQSGDSFSISYGITVYNLTTGEHGLIYANTSTTVSSQPLPSGWHVGDSYKVTDGWPCRDQIGMGADASAWPASAPYPVQEKVPAYLFDNKGVAGANLPASIYTGSEYTIKANRDFYDYNTTWSAGNALTSGVACGTLANRPTTCTEGTAYWATDQSCSDISGYIGDIATYPTRTAIDGTLYKCGASNTWSSYYTPPTYPDVRRGDCTNYPVTCDEETPAYYNVAYAVSGLGCSWSHDTLRTQVGSSASQSLTIQVGYKATIDKGTCDGGACTRKTTATAHSYTPTEDETVTVTCEKRTYAPMSVSQ